METKEVAVRQQNTDPAIVASAEGVKAQIQAAYMMAVKYPRSFDTSRDRILANCKRTSFAAKVEFAKPVGGKIIRGPSIRFAETALREWGNILTNVQVLYEDETMRRSRVTVIDLETNTTFSKEIQIAKTVERKNSAGYEVLGERTNTKNDKVFIVRATEDDVLNKEAAQVSKALRNEGLRLIPGDIIEEALELAKKTVAAGDKVDPAGAKKALFDAFSELGIKPKSIEEYLGRSVTTLQPSELQDLRGIYRAIKEGEAKWSDYIKKEVADDEAGEKEAAKTAAKFEKSIPKDVDPVILQEFLVRTADGNKTTVDQVKDEAVKKPKEFWAIVKAYQKSKTAKTDETAPAPCPNEPETTFLKAHCDECKDRKGCPVWA
jgi:hypothetical protein